MNGPAPSSAFSHLALAVGDLDAMAAFYTRTLGFSAGPPYASAGRRVAALMEGDVAGFRGIFLRRGDFLLELLEHANGTAAATVPRDAGEFGYAHTSFMVEDVAATVAEMEQLGGSRRTEFEHGVAGEQTTIIAFCLDPEGNRIELVSHPNELEAAAHAGFLGLGGLGWPAAAVAPRP